MANEQNKQHGEQGQGEREPGAMEQSVGSERGLGTRHYQDPFAAFDALFERLQQNLFGTSLLNALMPTRGDEGGGGTLVRVPRLQMRHAGDGLELTAEMPGIDPSNVAVRVENNVLTISGEQRAEEERGDGHAERYVRFYREIALPEGVDTEQAQASHRHGVLTIRFPGSRARATMREIPVTTEQRGQQQTGQPPTKERAA